jgi:hypothetical protein
MKIFLLLLFISCSVFCRAQYTYKNLSVNFLETPAESASYTFENLRLYPVYAKKSFTSQFNTVGKYMSLKDALQKGKVKVTEKGNEGTVNSVIIENTSKDTIIILPGDIIKGGKQDRIIQKDMLLKPNSGKKSLPVFCVESGRWQSDRQNTSDRSSGTARIPEFKEYKNKGSMSLRKVVEKEEDQAKVWDKVASINKTNKTETATKTYTAITNSADYNKQLDRYLKFFSSKFKQPDIIGVIIVSGDKVLGCDLFATHDLFALQFESLLHSYITEAILSGKPVNVKINTVKQYANKLMGDEQTQAAMVKEKGSSFTTGNKKLRVSSFD